jgi:hypothetical protein
VARQFAFYRTKISACGTIAQDGPMALAVLKQSFAGTESLLAEDRTGNGRYLYVLVRVGEAITEIRADPPDEAYSVLLGQQAAARR